MSEFDSPWKEVLDRFLQPCLRFFFPEVHDAIDWDRGYESLDTELQQIIREAELGPRLADKLFKVWLKNGEESWLLVHIEVQSQAHQKFAERMFIYHYRIYDRYRRPVVSLAVLGDDVPGWRPTRFESALLGCKLCLEFPVVKLLDWLGREEELEQDASPVAAVVLAHLKTVQTRTDLPTRKVWKMRLVRGLFERGLSAEEIRQWFRLIDWIMDLPVELEQQFRSELRQYEEESKMPYVTSVERLARAEGREEGREEGLQESIERGLQSRFGDAGLELVPTIRGIHDLAVLRAIVDVLWTASSADQIRALIK